MTVWRTERLVGFFLLEDELDFLVLPELRRALEEDEPLWEDRQLL